MTKANRWIGIVLGLIVLLTAAWFLVSPLFIDKTVDESFIFPAQTDMPTRSDVLAMSDDKRQKVMSDVMAKMASKPDKVMDEKVVPMTSPIITGHGEFKDADHIHRGSGDALLYQLQDGSHVIRFENFRVTNGPDLVVYLAKHSNPTTAAEVNEGYLEIGKLKGNIGNQNYIISTGTDISEFNSVVIWCDLFDVLFSPAALISTNP